MMYLQGDTTRLKERIPRKMNNEEMLMQGLCDAGCDEAAVEKICSLCEAGNYQEMLRLMKKERCELVEEMHKSQRKVDLLDYLIRKQTKKIDQ